MTEFYIRERDYGEVDGAGVIVMPLMITGEVLEQAEKGNSYLDPDEFIFYGEFETVDACNDHYVQKVAESLWAQ